MDCYRALGGCHQQGGDRKTPPQPSSSQSPGLSCKQVFQDLTPCWSDAGEGLTHFSITPTVGPAPGLAQKGISGHAPRTPVTAQIFVSSQGGDTALGDPWFLFSRGLRGQNTAAETLQDGRTDTS